MNIFGIGTDLVQIARIQTLYARFGEKFVQRILADSEIQQMQKLAEPETYLAKRFAGKEAIAKAFGTGIGRNIAFTDIHILNDEQGKPYVKLTGKAHNFTLLHRLKDIHISLTDEKEYALAFVLILN